MYTEDGEWVVPTGEAAWTNWCEGFVGGLAWSFAITTSNPWWEQTAVSIAAALEQRKTDTSVHDLGFLFVPTWKTWFDITGEPATEAVVLDAGRTLAKRFQVQAGYLSSFLSDDSTFIDIMMNVPLILYAAQRTGDQALAEIGTQHCLTTRRYLVRGDGSTAHEGIFDLSTGEFRRQSTQQGYRSDSSWARGQAWAFHGFATAFGLTRDSRFLDAACRTAEYYLANTPCWIPPNDWDEPGPSRPFESSAAAIACSGLQELAAVDPDLSRAHKWAVAADQTLLALARPPFVNENSGRDGVLDHATYHEKRRLGVDGSVVWGDYFFVRALHRRLRGGPGQQPLVGL